MQEIKENTNKWKEISDSLVEIINVIKMSVRGGVKMAEEQEGEITFSSTNSSKEQQNGEESLQNNF